MISTDQADKLISDMARYRYYGNYQAARDVLQQLIDKAYAKGQNATKDEIRRKLGL